MSSSVAIVGAGAIGAWLADAFDRAGWPVSMLARGATLDVLRGRGLRVARAGEMRVSHPRAGTAQELGVHDFVFLTVKAHILPQLAPSLAPLIGPSSVVVSGTNGIPWWFFQDFGGELKESRLESVDPNGSQEQTFPRQRTLGAVVHASARVLGPAQVEVVAADRLLLGEPGGEISARLEGVVAALCTGGISAEASGHIRHEVWAKLWGNMNINPLSALTRSRTAAMLGSAEVRELCAYMMREMQQCAERLDLKIDMTPEQRIGIALRLGNFSTSMLADLEAGRSLELGPQLGAIVEIARLLGIPAPFSRSILGLTRLISP